MRIADMNWMQVEAYLAADDRCVLPIGSTEQHAQLSLCVDAILAERVAVEAAEPLGVPVFPAMPFGLAPYFLAFPGTISLQVETLLAVVRDLVASVHRAGFRRVLIVNGHGGNMPVGALAQELMAGAPEPVAQVPQLVERAEDLGQGPGDRPVRHARELDGELPLDAARRRGGTGRAQSRRRISRSCAPLRRTTSARSSATARSAANTRSPTMSCWRCGGPGSRRSARRWRGRGRADPDLGRGRDRRHDRRLLAARRPRRAARRQGRRACRDLPDDGPRDRRAGRELHAGDRGGDAGRGRGRLPARRPCREGAAHRGGARARWRRILPPTASCSRPRTG